MKKKSCFKAVVGQAMPDIKNKVMLNLIQHLQRGLVLFKNGERGRSRIKYEMTGLFNDGGFTRPSSPPSVGVRGIGAAPTLYSAQKHYGMTNVVAGFTLIELLIVVLIIGILAAVALPQYQLAVGKSRLIKLVSMLTATVQAEERYYLANGVYTNKWEELDVSFPGTVSGAELTSSKNYYLRLTLKSSSGPDGVFATDPRLPGLQLYFGHLNTTYSTWAGLRTCYADPDNKLANELCRNITNQKKHNSTGGGQKVYYFQ